jgi:hypothetical protein
MTDQRHDHDHDHSHGHEHGHDHGHHGHGHAHGAGESALLWALWITAGFMLAEAIGGWLAGSLALVADAVHMLADAGALAMSYGAVRAGTGGLRQRSGSAAAVGVDRDRGDLPIAVPEPRECRHDDDRGRRWRDRQRIELQRAVRW